MSASPSPRSSASSHLVPRDRRRDRRPVARCAASTRRPSSCAGRSGSSRRTPCPAASALRHVDRAPASGRATRAAGRARARTASCRRRSTSGAVERHREVQALAARRLHDRDCRPSCVERVAQLERDAAAVERSSAGAPGIEVEHDRAWRCTGRRASTGWCAARARRGSRARRASGGPRRCSPALPAVRLEPGPTRRTQSGWCGGQRFSKNRSPAGAVGRPHERGRPAGEVGEHHRGDPAVVVDDVGFAEAGGGVQHLVEVRERELAALDLDADWPFACPPRPYRRMGPYAQCHLDRLDQLRSRAGAREARRRDEEQRRQLQPAREGDRRAHPLPQGLRRDRRRGHRRPDRARLRDLEGPLRDRRAAEIDALRPKGSHEIEIEEFVDLDEIDPLYFEQPYYLVPDERGREAVRAARRRDESSSTRSRSGAS